MASFESIGARPLLAEGLDKRLYHAACISMSNSLSVLYGQAEALAGAAGMPEDRARELLGALGASSLESIREKGYLAALTGPVERGDPDTCRALVQRVEEACPEQSGLFRQLGRQSVALAREKNPAGADWDEVEGVFSQGA